MRTSLFGLLLIVNLIACSSDEGSGPGSAAGTGPGGVPGNSGGAGGSVGGSGSPTGGRIGAGGSAPIAGASGMSAGGSLGGAGGSGVSGSGGASAGSSNAAGSSNTAGAGAAGAAGTPSAGNGGSGGSGVVNGGSNAGGSSGSPAGGGATAGGAGAPNQGGGGTGGAPSGGCGAGMLFCENFESLQNGPAQKTANWEPVTNNGQLTIDGEHARGQKALHVRTMGNGRAYMSLTSFSPPMNSFYGRMHVWVTAFPSAPNYAHYTLVEAAGTGEGLIRPIGGQYIEGNGALWGAGSDAGPTGDWTNWKTTAPAESGKWLCIEWQLDASDNNINVWIDGTAKPELSVSTKNHGGANVDFVFPMFNKLWVGWWLYQAGPTPNQYDLWFDDVAIATSRIGCGS